jgi:L-iditol 2-dehydrogenase
VYACAGPTVFHAFRLAERANCGLEKASVAVVQGLGPVGSFAVLYLAALGVPHIIAVAVKPDAKRAALVKRLGAAEVLSIAEMGEEGVLKFIRAAGDGTGADLAVEASGNPAAVPQGLAMLRNRGVYLIPGQYSNSGAVEIPPQMITFNALHIIGSSQYSTVDVKNYLGFLKKHPEFHGAILDLASCYPVAEVNSALNDAMAGKNIKTVLVR